MEKTLTIIQNMFTGGSANKGASADAAIPVVVFYNLSDLLGRPVRYEDESQPFASLYDIGGSTATAYPLSNALELTPRKGSTHLFLPWSPVSSMTGQVRLGRR